MLGTVHAERARADETFAVFRDVAFHVVKSELWMLKHQVSISLQKSPCEAKNSET